jgi:hypothetical protein
MISIVFTAASGALRRLVAGWRLVHALAYVTFALGLVHVLLAGSDTGAWWSLGFYVATLLGIAWALRRRFKRRRSGPPGEAGERWSTKNLARATGAATRALARARSSYQDTSDARRADAAPNDHPSQTHPNSDKTLSRGRGSHRPPLDTREGLLHYARVC